MKAGSNRNRITNNSCSYNDYPSYGIVIEGSDHNEIAGNNCSDVYHGIIITDSMNCTVRNNECRDNRFLGISLRRCKEMIVTGNTLVNSGITLSGEGKDLVYVNSHTIDQTNTVNGKPVFVMVGLNGSRAPEVAGQLILVDCMNMEVKDLVISNTSTGVTLILSSHISIENNTLSGNGVSGITVDYSNENYITNNYISDCPDGNGITIRDSDLNTLRQNTCVRCEVGVGLTSSDHNALLETTCNENKRNGISLYTSNYNEIRYTQCERNGRSGIRIGDNYGGRADHNIIQSCDLLNNDNGMYIFSDWNVMRDCEVSYNNYDGIIIYNGKHNTIIECSFVGNGGYGVYVSYKWGFLSPLSKNTNRLDDNIYSGNKRGDTHVYRDEIDYPPLTYPVCFCGFPLLVLYLIHYLYLKKFSASNRWQYR